MKRLLFVAFASMIISTTSALVVTPTAFSSSIVSHFNSCTGDEGTYMGQIPVYTFKMDSLRYGSYGKQKTAVGTEYMAALYSVRIGNDTYFKISINGESYAVIPNPYGTRVASESYYQAWLFKDSKYERLPELKHKASSYFLNLPYSNTSGNADKKSDSNVNGPEKKQEKALEWQPMGKVKAVSGMRTRRSGGEDDVVYDEEDAFLYTAFDGKNMKYKLVIARSGAQYDVYTNGSYNGAKVQWSRNGKYVQYLPSLSAMFTHHAGSYYFNVASAR